MGFLKDKVDEGFDPVEEVKDAEKQKWKHTSIRLIRLMRVS